jgi:uncharacterized membrane protein YphA (DoxX/SURF4 family)
MVLVRIVIGWHFLYEGWIKLVEPGWTSAGYLRSASGPLSSLFGWMGSNPATVTVINALNAWGLTLIGLGLILGICVRPAAWSGIALLATYYLAQPPLWAPYNGPNEGTYLLVNKNLVELCALVAVALIPAPGFSYKRLRRKTQDQEPGPIPRRQWIAELVGVPVLGAFVLAVLKKHGWNSFDALHAPGAGKASGAFAAGPTRSFRVASTSEVKGPMPRGSIGDLSLSRVIMGGNLMAGYAHARDLIYVDTLVKAYHSRDRIYETLSLGERCGLNAIVCNPILADVMASYRVRGGRMHFITNCGADNPVPLFQRSVDYGASSCYIHGGVADRAVKAGRVDSINEWLEAIRKLKVPAGIGAHRLDTVRRCVEAGIHPDYWVKTLHTVDYWSARPDDLRDNNWCEDPTATIAYMRELPEPWIAFKVLAAGASHPKVAFRYAFEGGADFICVGMYDFQVVDNVNTALKTLKGPLTRSRQWRA